MINREIYEEVLEISCELVNASGDDDTKSVWASYQKLKSICEKHEGSENDHPFQWETLGDFTRDDTASITIYEKALKLSQMKQVKEYEASVNFAIAERYQSLGNNDASRSFANLADELAIQTDNLDLRGEISELLLNLTRHT